VQFVQKHNRASILGREYQKRFLNLQALYSSSLTKNQELEQELLTAVDARTALEKRAESAEAEAALAVERSASLESEAARAAERVAFLEGELKTREEVINSQGRLLSEKTEKLKRLEPELERLWRKEKVYGELRDKYMESAVNKFRAWKAEAAKKMEIQFSVGEFFSYFFIEDIVKGMYPDAGIDWAAVQDAYNERTDAQNKAELDAKMAEALAAVGEEDPMAFWAKNDGFGAAAWPSTNPEVFTPGSSATGQRTPRAASEPGAAVEPSPTFDHQKETLPSNQGEADA
jgi:DNA repair exonuclease SbcCD ATPase subunit